MKALILAGHSNAALGTIQSLSKAGHEVHVVGFQKRFNKCFYSSFIKGKKVLPDPVIAPTEFLEGVRNYVATQDIQIIVPVSDVTAELLASSPGLPGLKMVTDEKTLVRLQDKYLSRQIAESCGIGVPRAELVGDRKYEGLQCLAWLDFPCVLKHRFSKRFYQGKFLHGGVYYVENKQRLPYILEQARQRDRELLIQEYIIGEGFGLSILAKNGKLLRAFAHRRIRESYPFGSQSSAAESIPLDIGLLECIEKVTQKISLTGVAMFEFKRSQGGPVLIEINGRLWGSLPLAIMAGVDFPSLYLDVARGVEISRDFSYRIGVKARWLRGDIAHVLHVLKGKPSWWPADFPPRAGIIRTLLGRGFRSFDIQTGDPWPGVMETAYFLTGGLIYKITGRGMAP